jgi:hypothetical protein
MMMLGFGLEREVLCIDNFELFEAQTQVGYGT